MHSWNRDPGFYKTPVVKSLIMLTSTSSLLHNLAIFKNSYPAVLLVRVWALPSLGVWLAAALIIYHCRLLERRRGTCNFISYLLWSGVVSTVLYASLLQTRELTGLPLTLIPGTLIHCLVGILALEYINTVTPTHSNLASLPLSSNLPFYILTSIFSATSISSTVLTLSGIVGGLVVRVLGLSLPPAPSWVTSPFMKLLAQDHPPRHYTGASLSVQAQQRTDEIEQIMLSMYNRQQQQVRRMVIGPPLRREFPQPPQQQVDQLTSMGFSQGESIQALQHTGNNMEAAIQLLATRHT